MRCLLAVLLVLFTAPQGDEPELAPIKKVTLKVESFPAIEALGRFSRAAGCIMEFERESRHTVGVDEEDQAKAMSLDLKEMPFFDAVESFCLAHGNLSYTVGERMRISFYGVPMKRSCNPQQGRFLLWHEDVEEEVRFDFSKTAKSCTVKIGIAWQPDIRVLEEGPVTVTSVVDDLGHELLAGGSIADENKEFKEWNTRGPLSRRIKLPLAPRGARSISLKGWIDLRVPKRSALVELPFREKPRPVRAARATIHGTRQGSGEEKSWTFLARPDDGKLAPEQFLDLRNGRGDGYEYWIGWGKGGGIRALDDGSVELLVKERSEDDLWLRFTLVEGRCPLRVPFELKEVPLPR